MTADTAFALGLTIFLVVALSTALVLVLVSLRRPRTAPLATAVALVVIALLAVVVAPRPLPTPVALGIGVIGMALAVIGGSPLTRRVLDIATGGTTREGERGGILLIDDRAKGGSAPPPAPREVLRGGATIGYLERLGVALALVAGFPEAIAVIVAIKGIGRFSELATPETRERFIIGTLASLLWAGTVGALVRLAIG